MKFAPLFSLPARAIGQVAPWTGVANAASRAQGSRSLDLRPGRDRVRPAPASIPLCGIERFGWPRTRVRNPVNVRRGNSASFIRLTRSAGRIWGNR